MADRLALYGAAAARLVTNRHVNSLSGSLAAMANAGRAFKVVLPRKTWSRAWCSPADRIIDHSFTDSSFRAVPGPVTLLSDLIRASVTCHPSPLTCSEQ